MSLRLEIWVEGPTDARTHSTWKGADEGDLPAASAGGALIPLLRNALLGLDRITDEKLADRLPEGRFVARLLTRKLRGVVSLGGRRRQAELSNHAWKVLAAIDQARAREPSTLVVAVWDRDGKDEPLRDRDRIHDVLRRRGEEGAAIAICVEEVEAWLLADGGAMVRSFGRGPRGGLPGAPETEPHPKEKLMEILDALGESGGDRAEIYRKIAEKVDIDMLARRCPKGFGELRKALREFIEPCLLAWPDESP